ncbi:MAG: hypothetical protein GW917_04070 [Bdellovibrionales bacterium]|nr:hypothetical protein [Bdellovibrionales bacterium]
MSEFEKRLSWPLYLANPEIIKSEGTFQFEEGCLSIPGYHEWVDRKKNVTVRAQNLDGEFFEFEADGLLSVCIQHEIDHLDGRLFLDRISMVKSTLLKNKIRKKGYPKHTESRNPL